VSTPITPGSPDWLRLMAACEVRCTDHEDAASLEAAADRIERLERENAALRKALEDAVGLARNTRDDGRRDWVSVGTWLKPGECVILTDAAALDAARAKEGGAT